MWSFVQQFLKIKYAIVLLTIAGGWHIYQLTRPDVPSLDSLRKSVAEEACWKAVSALPDDIDSKEKIVVLHLGGDKTGYVSNKLREIIDRTGKYNLMDKSFFARLLKELEIEEKEIGTFDEALSAGKKMGPAYVIFGEIERFASDRSTADIKLNLRMIDVENEKAVFSNVVEVSPSVAQEKMKAISPWSRLIFWILFTLLFPVITISVVKRVVAIESNPANLLMLLGYTFLSFLVAMAMMGFSVSSFWSGILLLFALMGAGFYNYWYCSYVEKMTK